MKKLRLWFTGGNAPELQKTQFRYSEDEEVVECIRGLRAVNGTGSFRWTPAVQAICILFIYSKAHHLKSFSSNNYKNFVLEGGKGTPAGSLSHAIGRQNDWLQSMFGLEYEGGLVVRKLFNHFNQQLKHKGRPARIFIDDNFFNIENLEILVNGNVAADFRLLEALGDSISKRWKNKDGESAPTRTFFFNDYEDEKFPNFFQPKTEENLDTDKLTADHNALGNEHLNDVFKEIIGEKEASSSANVCENYLEKQRDKGMLAPPFNNPAWRSTLESVIVAEIIEVLGGSNIFSKRSAANSIKKICENENFKKFSGGAKNIIHDIDADLVGAQRHGVFPDQHLRIHELKEKEPIRVAVSASHVGAIAILFYMRYVRGYNLKINLRYANSSTLGSDIKNEVFSNPPDVSILSIASGSSLLAHQGKVSYKPFMLFPNITYQIVSSSNNKGKIGENFLYNGSDVTASGFCFEELMSQGLLDKKKTNVEHGEPEDIAQSLTSGEDSLSAILWFPYYQFLNVNRSCSFNSLGDNKYRHKELMSFARKDFLADYPRAMAFDVAVRDAWIKLQNHPELVQVVVSLMIENRDFTRVLSRYGGMQGLIRSNNPTTTDISANTLLN